MSAHVNPLRSARIINSRHMAGLVQFLDPEIVIRSIVVPTFLPSLHETQSFLLVTIALRSDFDDMMDHTHG